MHTLRSRLILSHLLPVLLITPLIGFALIYLLETQVLLANITDQLTGQAQVLATQIAKNPAVWNGATEAHLFVSQAGSYMTARLTLISPNGEMLASSDPNDSSQVGQTIDIYQFNTLKNGQITVHTTYNQNSGPGQVELFMPVENSDHNLTGIVGLSYQPDRVETQFMRMRYLIIVVLAVSLLLGAALGWLLALNLQKSLKQVTDAVWQLSRGERMDPLPEQGTEEINLLANSVNTLVRGLQNMEQSRKQLLANLVHELARPLGALRSAIKSLQIGADQNIALRQELLTGMDEEASRLERLVDELAHLHEQVLGTLELRLQDTSIEEWLPRVLPPYREVAISKPLDWNLEIQPGIPIVLADQDRLAQAVGNLVSNAIKYTPPGGKISISAGFDNEWSWISVTDTGPGISHEEQQLIFKPFFRGKQGRRFPQGMGLGLSIARDLAEAHLGEIKMVSVPGKGSSFTIRLPHL
jgi:two-component system sensor histidine kinase BaeS